MATALRTMRRALSRTRDNYRLRLFAALFSSIVASAVFIALYYALFYFVPAISGDGINGLMQADWLGKFDMAQFFGTLIDPPDPTPTTWLIGLVLLFGAVFSACVAYCVLLAWAMKSSKAEYGAIFGLILFMILGLTVWTGPGFQPAVMRNSIPDVGFFLLGWSGSATLALLATNLMTGLTVATVYARLCNNRS